MRLEEAAPRLVRDGSPHKADLLEVELDGVRLLVKDFGRRSWWRRLVGRLQVSRETRAYRRLEGVKGLPRFFGRIDKHSLAIEKIESTPVRAGVGDRHGDRRLIRRLGSIVRAMHRRGIAHMDLRGVGNVLLDARGRPVIVDLAAAILFTPGSPVDRFIIRWLRFADLTGVLKWKVRLLPDEVTPEEWRVLRRFRFARCFWLLNLGHLWPSRLAERDGWAVRDRWPVSEARRERSVARTPRGRSTPSA